MTVKYERVLGFALSSGVLPKMAFTERLRPKGVSFSGFRVGISLIEVYERVGKSVIQVSERAQKGLQMNFMAL